MKQIVCEKVNKKLIKKVPFDYKSWTMQIYRQFGIEDFEQLVKQSKKDPEWFKKYKWMRGCYNEFCKEFIKKQTHIHKKLAQKELSWLMLSIGPTEVENEN